MNSLLNFFARREQTPVESRDYGQIYLALSGLLFLGTMWAVVDEVLTRRPWKDYQQEYHALASEKWQKRYTEAVERFDSTALAEIEAELTQVQLKLNSPEYVDAVESIRRIDTELLEVNRRFTFAKSLEDETYYFWKKSIHDGKENIRLKERLEEHIRVKMDAGKEVERLEAERAQLQNVVEKFNQELRAVQKKRNDLYADIRTAESKTQAIRSSPILIQQVIMNNFDRSNFGTPKARVDRCQTCHAGWNDDTMDSEEVPLVFRKHPVPELLTLHNPEVFGCTPCHQGQGPALTAGFAHGYDDHYWEWPLLKGVEVYASCNKCHGNELHLKHAEPLNKAKLLLAESGCYGCHEIKGFVDLPKIGPELNQLTAKASPDWLFRWIRNPKDYNPNTRMPNFRFSDDEAEAITAYLWKIGNENQSKSAKGAFVGGSAERGRGLVDNVGCKGCHVVAGDTRMRDSRALSFDIAPELSLVGSKVNPDWLYDWIRNPRHFRPSTQMPSLRLTDAEARDVVAYLMTLKDPRRFEDKKLDLTSPEVIRRGDKLIREFGCHGCHSIQGMEKEGRVSVALSNFGRKRVDELDFGDTKVPHTWDDWVFNKIKDARVFSTDRIISKMPVFAFTDSEIVLLRTLLRSFTREEPGQDYQKPYDKRQQDIEAGRRLAVHYNCVNCHVVEETGSYVAATLDDEGLAPPPLRPEGAKVQETWLHDFLKNPATIRPWLKLRMPTFSLTDDEITRLTKYFLAIQNKELELRDYKSFQPDPRYVTAGKGLFDDFQCLSCHFTGPVPADRSPGDLAPNLALARSRLKPEWILDWMANPGEIQPGTRMPTYFPDMESPEPDVLGGDAREQIKALRDYVISLGK
jgi:mono/diheme cytochrome c family protein